MTLLTIRLKHSSCRNLSLQVRFDDTNPSKEKDEFVESIIKDTKDLGLEWEATTYTSDYFPQVNDALHGDPAHNDEHNDEDDDGDDDYATPSSPQMLDLGQRMIKAGLMYADDTGVEQVSRVVSACGKGGPQPLLLDTY